MAGLLLWRTNYIVRLALLVQILLKVIREGLVVTAPDSMSIPFEHIPLPKLESEG